MLILLFADNGRVTGRYRPICSDVARSTLIFTASMMDWVKGCFPERNFIFMLSLTTVFSGISTVLPFTGADSLTLISARNTARDNVCSMLILNLLPLKEEKMFHEG